MIENELLYSKTNTLHDTMNTEVKANNNYEVASFNTARYRRITTLLTEGVSQLNHLFRNKIIRDENDDKHEMYNVSEKYIITYTNNHVYSSDSIIVKVIKIPGISMFTTAGNRKSMPFQTKRYEMQSPCVDVVLL